MNSHVRRGSTFAVLCAALVLGAATAEAKLPGPSYQGPLSNGQFSGLPIRADQAAARPAAAGEVVGENCYFAAREARGSGRRTGSAQVCE